MDQGEDGPLTAAEEELTWYPSPPRRDLTLDDQELEKHCPLSQHRPSKKPQYDLGELESLPLELLSLIMGHLDIESLMSLQRVNCRGFDIVNKMSPLRAVIEHCPDVLRAILSTETSRFIQCQQLFSKLTASRCEYCPDFGGYLYLLTCTRVCDRCFTARPRFLPIERVNACRWFGLSEADADRLPYMRSVPGDYLVVGVSFHTRSILLDSYTARRTAIASLDHDSWVTDPSVYESAVSAAVRYRAEFHDQWGCNPHRFMAIVEIPYLDIRTGTANWGFCCYACRDGWSPLRHAYRQFLAADFRRHLQQFGRVVNTLHVRAYGTLRESRDGI